MKLYAAPLQGFTEAPWRNLHQEVFGGIDAYYTPFVHEPSVQRLLTSCEVTERFSHSA